MAHIYIYTYTYTTYIYMCVSLDVIYTCILFTKFNIPGEMFRVNGREREAEMVKRNVFSHFQQR